MSKTKTETMWAIAGNCGLYTGTQLTRKKAILHHTTELFRDWEYCKAKGDYPVKVKITYTPQKHKN